MSREGALETGGGIFAALPLLGPGPFLVISGDIWSEFPLASCVDRLASGDVAHFVLVPNPAFHAQGDFGLEDGRLLDRAPRFTYANIGVLRAEFFAGRQAGALCRGAADVRMDPPRPRQRRAVSRALAQPRHTCATRAARRGAARAESRQRLIVSRRHFSVLIMQAERVRWLRRGARRVARDRCVLSRCLPSASKLYTLRGVSAVYVTVTSIRNLRTTSFLTLLVRPGETGVVCRYEHTQSNEHTRLRTKFCGADPIPRLHHRTIVELHSMPYAPAQDSSFLTRRGLVFLADRGAPSSGCSGVLNSGLSHQIIDVVLGPIETRMIEEAPDTDEPPPPPPPKIETPPPFVPPPEVVHRDPGRGDARRRPSTQTTIAASRRRSRRPSRAGRRCRARRRKSDSRRPLSQPEYPPSSRRAGEAGTVILEVYVLENRSRRRGACEAVERLPASGRSGGARSEALLAACAGNREWQTGSDVGAVRRHIQAHGLTES